MGSVGRGLFVHVGLACLTSPVLLWVMLHAWLLLAGPVHRYVVTSVGTSAAIFADVLLTVVLGHAAAAVLTVPALHGVSAGKIQIKRTATYKQVMKTTPLVGLNFMISVVVGYVGTMLMTESKYNLRLDISSDLPGFLSVVCHALFYLAGGEVIFFYAHWLGHKSKWLYAHVHKIHHTWSAPVAWVTTYAHPLEHLCVNLASVAVPPYLLGAHPAVTLAHSLVFQVFAAIHHSGYWSDDEGMHDLHHEAFNVNFGPLGVLDYLHGTFQATAMQKAKACEKKERENKED